jgi:hypothetical protein
MSDTGGAALSRTILTCFRIEGAAVVDRRPDELAHLRIPKEREPRRHHECTHPVSLWNATRQLVSIFAVGLRRMPSTDRLSIAEARQQHADCRVPGGTDSVACLDVASAGACLRDHVDDLHSCRRSERVCLLVRWRKRRLLLLLRRLPELETKAFEPNVIPQFDPFSPYLLRRCPSAVSPRISACQRDSATATARKWPDVWVALDDQFLSVYLICERSECE